LTSHFKLSLQGKTEHTHTQNTNKINFIFILNEFVESSLIQVKRNNMRILFYTCNYHSTVTLTVTIL